MATMTRDAFDHLVEEWARARGGSFHRNWPVKGGWEAWIQVDLTAFLLEQNDTYDVLREQNVYTNALARCDLLVNPTDPAPARLVVELKAESLENHARLGGGVEQDAYKIQNERVAPYTASVGIVLAVVFSQQGWDAVAGIYLEERREMFGILYGDRGGEFAILGAHAVDGTWQRPLRPALLPRRARTTV